jgi:hypothetical protein
MFFKKWDEAWSSGSQFNGFEVVKNDVDVGQPYVSPGCLKKSMIFTGWSHIKSPSFSKKNRILAIIMMCLLKNVMFYKVFLHKISR